MLAQIQRNVQIDFNLEKCRWRKYNKEKVIQILKELEFYSLIERLPEFKKSRENAKIKKAKVGQSRSKINLQRGEQKTLF